MSSHTRSALRGLVVTLVVSALTWATASTAVAAVDVTPPLLTQLDVQVPPNATPGDVVSVTYTATDDAADLGDIALRFRDPTGQSRTISQVLLSTTPKSGTFTTVIPTTWVSGQYVLQTVTVRDQSNYITEYRRDGGVDHYPTWLTVPSTHTYDLSSADFTLTGTSPDVTPPLLTQLDVQVPPNATPGDVVSVTYTATDDAADLGDIALRFRDPTGQSRTISQVLLSTTPKSGTFTTVIPTTWVSGQYVLQTVTVRDQSNYITEYRRDGGVDHYPTWLTVPSTHTYDLSSADFTLTGTSPDVTPPLLTQLDVQVPPNATPGDVVSVTYTATDDAADLGDIALRFRDPTGQSRTISQVLLSTTPKSGTFTTVIPTTWVSGQYVLQTVTVRDQSNYITEYRRDGGVDHYPTWLTVPSTHTYNLSSADFTLTGTSAAATAVTVDGLPSSGPLVLGPADLITGQVRSVAGIPSGIVTASFGGLSTSATLTGGQFSIAPPLRQSTPQPVELRYEGASGLLSSAITVNVVLRSTSSSPPGGSSGGGSNSGSAPPPAPPTPAPSAPPRVVDLSVPGAHRLAGGDRIATALATSLAVFPKGAKAAVLASSDNYADALAGGRLASAAGGPLLLASPRGVHPDVLQALQRLLPSGGTVYLLGGTDSLSKDVATQLEQSGLRVRRLGGKDRYETAEQIAAEVKGISRADGPIYLASGTNYPDGLAVAALAAKTDGVVMLTQGDKMSAATAAYLAQNDPTGQRTVAVGGPAAAAAPDEVKRIVGKDRYETAALVASEFSGSGAVKAVGLASGNDWPDALVAAAVMGTLGGPLVLSEGKALDAGTLSVISSLHHEGGARTGVIFGGEAVLSAAAQEALEARL